MTKPFKNNKRRQAILIIIWALALAITLLGVYLYYNNKIEQLEQSIEKQPAPVSHRMYESDNTR